MTVLTLQSEIYSHGSGSLARLLETLKTWRQRRRGRIQLGQMGAHDLHDLGLSPSDVYAEIEKPFWQA